MEHRKPGEHVLTLDDDAPRDQLEVQEVFDRIGWGWFQQRLLYLTGLIVCDTFALR